MSANRYEPAFYINYGNGSSTGYYAITQWATGQAKTVGNTVRATAPAFGAERVYVCVVAGTTAASQPTWDTTKGAKTNDGAQLVWQEASGQPGINGDTTNTASWTTLKGVTTDAVLGQIIKGGTTYIFICTTAGAMGGSEPSWNTTTGATTTDSSAVWTCLGAASSFSAWANPHARLYNAIATTWAVYWSKCFVSNNSAETNSSATTYTFPGTNASVMHALCINDASSLPPSHSSVTTGASLNTTGASNLILDGGAELNGIALNAGSGANTATISVASTNGSYITLKNCALKRVSTSAVSVNVGTSQCYVRLENTTYQCGNVSDLITLGGHVEWFNTPSLVQGATIPNNLFRGNVANKVLIDGCDLSAVGSGKYIVTGAANQSGEILFRNCKLNADVTLINTTNLENLINVATFINCSSTSVNSMCAKGNEGGVLTSEATVIRTGGCATSWKIVTTGYANSFTAFETFDLVIWNTVETGSLTATIYGITDAGARPYPYQIWTEFWYMGSSTEPTHTHASTGNASILDNGSQYATDSSTWGGSTTKFKMTATLSPRKAGPIYARIRIGDIMTVYIDPKIYLT